MVLTGGMSQSVPQLLHEFRTHAATSPRLTWYGPDSERVELSGRVLDNWVAKTTNFLVEELDAAPSVTVGLDLPAHWRALCWALAAWQCGATVVFASTANNNDDGGSPSAHSAWPAVSLDVVATADPTGAPAGDLQVAVALGALELRWRGDLPVGTIDYSGQVRAFGDVYFPDEPPTDVDVAVRYDEAAVTYGELLDSWVGTGADTAPQRTLLRATTLVETVRQALKVWLAGGSVVLVHPELDVTEKFVAAERITAGY